MKSALASVFFIIVLIGCGDKPTTNLPKSGNIDESIIQLLMAHYAIDPQDSNWVITRDSIAVNAEYHDPELMIDGEIMLSEMTVYSFPVKASGYLFGDLNGDNQDEVVLNEVVLGSTHGPLMNDVFVFQGAPGAYKKIIASTAYELSQCNEGAFTPERITDGLLFGNASCFDDDDPMCCPSLSFDVSYKLQGDKLMLNEKKPKAAA